MHLCRLMWLQANPFLVCSVESVLSCLATGECSVVFSADKIKICGLWQNRASPDNNDRRMLKRIWLQIVTEMFQGRIFQLNSELRESPWVIFFPNYSLNFFWITTLTFLVFGETSENKLYTLLFWRLTELFHLHSVHTSASISLTCKCHELQMTHYPISASDLLKRPYCCWNPDQCKQNVLLWVQLGFVVILKKVSSWFI